MNKLFKYIEQFTVNQSTRCIFRSTKLVFWSTKSSNQLEPYFRSLETSDSGWLQLSLPMLSLPLVLITISLNLTHHSLSWVIFFSASRPSDAPSPLTHSSCILLAPLVYSSTKLFILLMHQGHQFPSHVILLACLNLLLQTRLSSILLILLVPQVSHTTLHCTQKVIR